MCAQPAWHQNNRSTSAKANEYLGAENWAALKKLANQMMTPGELENMIDKKVSQLRAQIDAAINSALNGKIADLNALPAKIDELKAHFDNIALSKDEIEAKLIQAAKNALNNAKNEITDSAIQFHKNRHPFVYTLRRRQLMDLREAINKRMSVINCGLLIGFTGCFYSVLQSVHRHVNSEAQENASF